MIQHQEGDGDEAGTGLAELVGDEAHVVQDGLGRACRARREEDQVQDAPPIGGRRRGHWMTPCRSA